MGAKSLDELRAYQKARAFKLEVYRLVDESSEAQRDRKFRSQLMESAASNEMNIREGFRRYRAGDMAHFLSIALASLAEALGWLEDGIDGRYFRREDCLHALALGDASDKTTMALHQSLQPYIRKKPRPPPRPQRHPE
jgi:four helix bundle protein